MRSERLEITTVHAMRAKACINGVLVDENPQHISPLRSIVPFSEAFPCQMEDARIPSDYNRKVKLKHQKSKHLDFSACRRWSYGDLAWPPDHQASIHGREWRHRNRRSAASFRLHVGEQASQRIEVVGSFPCDQSRCCWSQVWSRYILPPKGQLLCRFFETRQPEADLRIVQERRWPEAKWSKAVRSRPSYRGGSLASSHRLAADWCYPG